jgi:mannose-6-phosphate isomerase
MPLKEIGLLHFGEQYFERIWGGRKLRSLYGKETPLDKPIGEAWLISDHAGDESVVDEGPYSGTTFRDLLDEDAYHILGRRASRTIHGRFPLLLKILDSEDHLSVQVHPDDDCAKRLGEPDVGKTEMWHVLQSDPGSELICGLSQAATIDRFAAAVADGSVEDLMTRFTVREGDSAFVAAGTVHAIGGGIVLAEIQQNSDLTYRIYDWGRVQSDGTPRELHVDKALEAIHFGSRHGGKARPLARPSEGANHTILAACRHFAAERIEVGQSFCRNSRGDSFHIILCCSGTLSVAAGPSFRALDTGEAVIVLGGTKHFAVEGSGVFMDYYVPDLQHDIVVPLREAGHQPEDILHLGGDPASSDLRNPLPRE